MRLGWRSAPGESSGMVRATVETNLNEISPFLPHTELPYSVTSPWFTGACTVKTFALEELMATKLRTLYQRRKGRDLFDLWHVLVALEPDDGQIVAGLRHYMGEDIFTYPQLAQNLAAKLNDPDFSGDPRALVTQLPSDDALAAAADLVMERLGGRLRNAPLPDRIADGVWRTAA